MDSPKSNLQVTKEEEEKHKLELKRQEEEKKREIEEMHEREKVRKEQEKEAQKENTERNNPSMIARDKDKDKEIGKEIGSGQPYALGKGQGPNAVKQGNVVSESKSGPKYNTEDGLPPRFVGGQLEPVNAKKPKPVV